MQRNATETLRADLMHGHSRLTWLLDELDAHLTALAAEPEGVDYILDEFQVYWSEFAGHLREHIIEEEDELFPLVRLHATNTDIEKLGALQIEHVRLLIDLQKMETEVRNLSNPDPGERAAVIERMQSATRELRQHLAAHSSNERQFLREVEVRIADACLT